MQTQSAVAVARWTKAVVVINLNIAPEGDVGERDAWMSEAAPGVCIVRPHWNNRGPFNVTHTHSGKAIVPSCPTLASAKLAALAISSLLDCTVDGAALMAQVNESNRARVFQIRRDAVLA